MKRVLFIISTIAIFTACGNKTQNAGDGTDTAEVVKDSTEVVEEKPQVPALQTDSIGQEKTDKKAQISVVVDWPTDGDKILVNTVRKYICKSFGIKMTEDGHTAVKKAFQKYYNETAAMWDEEYSNDTGDSEIQDGDDMEEDVSPVGLCYSYLTSVRKIAETDKFVTYLLEYETFSGGAHGSITSAGTTFSKTTAKTPGYETVVNDETFATSIKNQTLFNDKVKGKEFNALLIKGLKDYFKDVDTDRKKPLTDAELAEMLMDEKISKLPLPSASPYFTEKGLVFMYQQYEIAAYCYGMPNFCIPYDKITPYLTDEAKELIP